MNGRIESINVIFFFWNSLVTHGVKFDEHIIIGTPEKVLNWCSNFHVFDMNKVSMFVLDEADTMIETKNNHDQCIEIHKYVLFVCFCSSSWAVIYLHSYNNGLFI